MVKMGVGLSRPISGQRGIRQGCLLFGQLYSLAIESLLCRLSEQLSGLSLPVSCSVVHNPFVLFAYADVVNVLFTTQWCVQHLQDAISLY